MATQVNYTSEQTLKMVADYASGATVETIAAELGKNVRSIVAKLSREGVYKKKEYASKTGEKPVKKDALADSIGKIMGFTEAEITSLAEVNKTVLVALLEKLQAE